MALFHFIVAYALTLNKTRFPFLRTEGDFVAQYIITTQLPRQCRMNPLWNICKSANTLGLTWLPGLINAAIIR